MVNNNKPLSSIPVNHHSSTLNINKNHQHHSLTNIHQFKSTNHKSSSVEEIIPLTTHKRPRNDQDKQLIGSASTCPISATKNNHVSSPELSPQPICDQIQSIRPIHKTSLKNNLKRRRSDDDSNFTTTINTKQIHTEEETLDSMIIENVVKASSVVPVNFLEPMNITDRMDKVREVVVDWMMEVANEFNTTLQTIALAINIFDRCLFQLNIPREKLQLVGAVALLIACKAEEVDSPAPKDIVYICDHSYTLEDVITMEATILSLLSFRVTVPTPFTILQRLCDRIQDKPMAFQKVTEFALRVALLNDEISCITPGAIAIGGIKATMKIYNLPQTSLQHWPKSIKRHISEEKTDGIAESIFRTWRQFRERISLTCQQRWLIDNWEGMCVLFDNHVKLSYAKDEEDSDEEEDENDNSEDSDDEEE